MGQMTKCDEGHFYDKSLNKSCPHCGIGAIDKTIKAKSKHDSADRGDGPDDERTVQASSRERQHRRADGDVTVAVWRQKSGIDPVVGWLVCFEGPNQGRDYRIHSGRNAIGRDLTSQICISGDETISRENHAKIFFDTRNASFHVTEGEGRSGVYVNGSIVLQPTILEAYDILEIGATKLAFVPLCGESFRWDDKEMGKEKGKETQGRGRQVEPPAEPETKPHGRDPDVTKAV